MTAEPISEMPLEGVHQYTQTGLKWLSVQIHRRHPQGGRKRTEGEKRTASQKKARE